jgi:predicted dehydrogenase
MRVAVLGLGSAGTRHARNLLDAGHEVVGFDPGPVPAPDGVTRVGSAESAIASAEAVIVASPNSLHGDQAVLALEQGRHVLVEKPLATSVAEAKRVVEAAERAAVVCGVAMNLRFHPGILELKRLLDEGALGAVRFVQASFGYDLRLWHPGSDYRRSYSARADLGGGIVFDAIHELDYLLWLLGPVSTVSAESDHISDLEADVEDVAVAILRFESGPVGVVDMNYFEPVYRRGCAVIGAAAVARWDWSTAKVTVCFKGEEAHVTDARCDLEETYLAELVDFFNAVETGSEPRTPARDGLMAVRLAEALKKSAKHGQRFSANR